MSQQNVELVRRAWDVFIKGLAQGNPAAVFDEGLFAPRHALTPVREIPGGKAYVGREGFVDFVRTWTEDFVGWQIWPEEVIDVGNNRVVAVVHQSARGKASGAVVEAQFAIVYTIDGGQVIDQRHYLDHGDALAGAGVSEEDVRAG